MSSWLTPKHLDDAARVLRGVALVLARAAVNRCAGWRDSGMGNAPRSRPGAALRMRLRWPPLTCCCRPPRAAPATCWCAVAACVLLTPTARRTARQWARQRRPSAQQRSWWRASLQRSWRRQAAARQQQPSTLWWATSFQRARRRRALQCQRRRHTGRRRRHRISGSGRRCSSHGSRQQQVHLPSRPRNSRGTPRHCSSSSRWLPARRVRPCSPRRRHRRRRRRSQSGSSNTSRSSSRSRRRHMLWSARQSLPRAHRRWSRRLTQQRLCSLQPPRWLTPGFPGTRT